MTSSRRIRSETELIEYFVDAVVSTIAGIIRHCPPESHPDLWHHAHAAMEAAIRQRLEKGPTS
jgi:hypothetical protein